MEKARKEDQVVEKLGGVATLLETQPREIKSDYN